MPTSPLPDTVQTHIREALHSIGMLMELPSHRERLEVCRAVRERLADALQQTEAGLSEEERRTFPVSGPDNPYTLALRTTDMLDERGYLPCHDCHGCGSEFFFVTLQGVLRCRRCTTSYRLTPVKKEDQ